MDIRAKRLDELDPAPWNPRAIGDRALDGLRASIDRFGLVEPIVWNERTGHVIGGHQRLKVLQAKGVEETEVVVVDLPEAEEKALNVTLNNPNIQGHFTKGLQVVLDEVKIEVPGMFVELQLDDLHIEVPADGEAGADEVPTDAERRTAAGQLWSCGRHLLLCGDATEPASWTALIGDSPARMAFTDPPYSTDYNPDVRPKPDPNVRSPKRALNKRRMGRIVSDGMPRDEYRQFLVTALGNLLDSLKAGASFYLCCGYSSYVDYVTVLEAHEILLSGCIVWDKGAMVLDRKDYHSCYEFILYGWKRGAAHGFRGPNNEVDLWSVRRDPAMSYEHPTQKPVELAGRAIRNSSRAGDVVVDCFGGSGSTMIACEQLDRECRMMEIDPRFCDVIVARWERFTGGAAELVVEPKKKTKRKEKTK